MDSKSIVRRAVREHLDTQPDVDPEEFEVVFDDVYNALERRFAEGRDVEQNLDEEGLPFDAASVSDTMISLTCFVAIALLTAAVKTEAKSVSSRMLDRIEEKLAAQTGKPKMIHDIRQRIERILDAL